MVEGNSTWERDIPEGKLPINQGLCLNNPVVSVPRR